MCVNGPQNSSLLCPNPCICQQWGALQEADTTGGILLGHRYHVLLWQVSCPLLWPATLCLSCRAALGSCSLANCFISSLGNNTWQLGHFCKTAHQKAAREKGGWAYRCCFLSIFLSGWPVLRDKGDCGIQQLEVTHSRTANLQSCLWEAAHSVCKKAYFGPSAAQVSTLWCSGFLRVTPFLLYHASKLLENANRAHLALAPHVWLLCISSRELMHQPPLTGCPGGSEGSSRFPLLCGCLIPGDAAAGSSSLIHLW